MTDDLFDAFMIKFNYTGCGDFNISNKTFNWPTDMIPMIYDHFWLNHTARPRIPHWNQFIENAMPITKINKIKIAARAIFRSRCDTVHTKEQLFLLNHKSLYLSWLKMSFVGQCAAIFLLNYKKKTRTTKKERQKARFSFFCNDSVLCTSHRSSAIAQKTPSVCHIHAYVHSSTKGDPYMVNEVNPAGYLIFNQCAPHIYHLNVNLFQKHPSTFIGWVGEKEQNMIKMH